MELMGRLGQPPAGVDAVAHANERSEGIHSMLEQLVQASAPPRLPNGAPVRWLGVQNMPTLNIRTGSIQSVVSVEFVVTGGLPPASTFHTTAADVAQNYVANGSTIFDANLTLVQKIRAVDDQRGRMPDSIFVAHKTAWPWSQDNMFNPSPAAAMDSLAITAALSGSLPPGCSLDEPAFLNKVLLYDDSSGIVMVSASIQCPANTDPLKDIAPSVFQAVGTCIMGWDAAHVAYANVFTHSTAQWDADDIRRTLITKCPEGMSDLFGGRSELVHARCVHYDSDEEDEAVDAE